jgi:hypothetical protein
MGHHLATAHLMMTKRKWIRSDEFCIKTLLACLHQDEGTNLDAVVGEQQLDAARVAVRQPASIPDDLMSRGSEQTRTRQATRKKVTHATHNGSVRAHRVTAAGIGEVGPVSVSAQLLAHVPAPRHKLGVCVAKSERASEEACSQV